MERPEGSREQKETERKKPEVFEKAKNVESSPRKDNPEEPNDKKVDEVVGYFTLGIYDAKDKLFKKEMSDKDFDKVIDAIKGDGFRSEIKQKIEAGYKFKNFSESGFKICWTKNGKENIEINPIFKNKEIFNLLKDDLQSRLKEKKIAENTERSFNEIIQYLKANRFINKKLDINVIKKSGFGDEVYSALSANYQSKSAGNGEVYNIKSTRTGFILKVTEPFKKQGYTDLEYNMYEDFDANLNRIFKNPEKLTAKEEKISKKEKEKEKRKQELSKKASKYKSIIDNLTSKYPIINSLHQEVQSFIEDIPKIIEESANRGEKPYKEVERIIEERGLKKRWEELEKNYAGDGPLHEAIEEYGENIEALIEVTAMVHEIGMNKTSSER